MAQDIHKRYLCRHRSPWYAQDERPAAPLVCTYMGRRNTSDGTPFRFFLNHSRATTPNVYLLLYPRPILAVQFRSDPGVLRTIWAYLNRVPIERLLGEGRVYGGGLYKLEPGELANTPVDDLLELLPGLAESRRAPGWEAFPPTGNGAPLQLEIGF